uniref:hypothetical protein n=1 Tax=Amycolatopsis sp. CA-096443 TaxID=3239919 RepID=UPI003F492CDF
MDTYYRIQHADRATATLLDESTWNSACWEARYIPCPDCAGSGCANCVHGEIEDIRCGVSVCGSVEGLCDYFRRRTDHSDAYIDRLVLVELRGTLAVDDDHDSSDGAELVYPREIVAVTPIPDQLRVVLRGEGD